MPRDYKNSGQRASGKGAASSGLPGWVPLLVGLSIGLAVAFAVHLHHTQGLPAPLVSRQPASVVEPAPAPEAQQRPRFEFYQLLPEMEVVVPEEEERQLRAQPRQQASPQAKPAPITPGARYLLQAGSFQSFGDADRLKARLALLGVEAKIQTVEIRGGETWHRVRIGPFSDSKELDSVRRQLESNNVEAILLKLSS